HLRAADVVQARDRVVGEDEAVVAFASLDQGGAGAVGEVAARHDEGGHAPAAQQVVQAGAVEGAPAGLEQGDLALPPAAGARRTAAAPGREAGRRAAGPRWCPGRRTGTRTGSPAARRW